MPPVFVIFRGPFFPALEHSPIAGQKYCRNAVFLHDGTAAIAIRDGVTDVFQPASAGTVTSVVCGSFRLCSLNRLMNQKQGGYEQQASLETVGENGLATHDFSPENNIWSRIVESAISCRKEKKVTNPERFFSLTTMPPRHHLLCHRFFILFHVGSRESNRLQHPVGHCCQPLRHSVKSRLCLNVDMLCSRLVRSLDSPGRSCCACISLNRNLCRSCPLRCPGLQEIHSPAPLHLPLTKTFQLPCQS